MTTEIMDPFLAELELELWNEKCDRFIDFLSTSGDIYAAAAHAGANLADLYARRDSPDGRFDARWNAALEAAIEPASWRAALQGDPVAVTYKGEVTATVLERDKAMRMLLLKSKGRGYSEKTTTEHTGTVRHEHSVDRNSPEYKAREAEADEIQRTRKALVAEILRRIDNPDDTGLPAITQQIQDAEFAPVEESDDDDSTEISRG
jgi:hypothetical protein